MGALGVAGAEDDAVGLGLLEELADGFETLDTKLKSTHYVLLHILGSD